LGLIKQAWEAIRSGYSLEDFIYLALGLIFLNEMLDYIGIFQSDTLDIWLK